MLYGIGRVDSSGRAANREIIEALHWQPGDRLETVLMPRAIVIRACPDGPLRVPQRPAIVIPRPARTLHRIEAGDHVLLAAAPAYDLVIVHTLSALDDMLAGMSRRWVFCRLRQLALKASPSRPYAATGAPRDDHP
jgi:hypothetical protein